MSHDSGFSLATAYKDPSYILIQLVIVIRNVLIRAVNRHSIGGVNTILPISLGDIVSRLGHIDGTWRIQIGLTPIMWVALARLNNITETF